MSKNSQDIITTEDEYINNYIEKYYLIKSDKEIGQCLHMTKKQVQQRRLKLGFKRQRQTYNKHTPEGMKWCWKCNMYHPIEMFSKNRSKPDGLQDECKIACKKITLERKNKKIKENNIEHKLKLCQQCGIMKSLDSFVRNVSTEDGFTNICIECLNRNTNKKIYKNKVEGEE